MTEGESAFYIWKTNLVINLSDTLALPTFLYVREFALWKGAIRKVLCLFWKYKA